MWMPKVSGHVDRPWVAPEICPSSHWSSESCPDMRLAMARVDNALDERSVGKLVRALVSLRAALRARLDETCSRSPTGEQLPSTGPWKRRLHKRYGASLYAVERLLEQAWACCEFDAIEPAVQEQLMRLRRLESLDNQAHLDRYWIDIGEGD
jgi:hypothetical protein